MSGKPEILMHVCCGTCLLFPYFTLSEHYDVALYYFNPNIHPREEYIKRLEGVRRVSSKYGIPLIEGRYDTALWHKKAEGLENEPEKGKRCAACFRLRFMETARTAQEKGFGIFCSTLSISPHKDVRTINRLGKEAAGAFGLEFLEKDFKKKDGFKKTIFLSKKMDLYRQNYCGCIYSKR